MNETEILQLHLGNPYRLIVISDIHGHFSLLHRLLAKVNFTANDKLIILGDIIEKGNRNAQTLEYLYALSSHENVWVVKGNVDTVCDKLLFHFSLEKVMEYNTRRPQNIFTEWAKAEGFANISPENCNQVRDAIIHRYAEPIAWLRNLPVIIETEEFIFVHAGLDNIPDWENTTTTNAMKRDDFLLQGHQANKWVVVGHWPTSNYLESGATYLPIIHSEKRIIAIDGGCGIKRGGQLNALIITNNTGDLQFDSAFVDDCPQVQMNQTVHTENLLFTKGDFRHPTVEILEKGLFFSKCRILHTDTITSIKNEYLLSDSDGGYYSYNICSNMLSATYGETVSIIDNSCEGYALVRNIASGEMGWIPKEALDLTSLLETKPREYSKI